MKGKDLDHLLRSNYYNRVIKEVEKDNLQGEDRLVKYPFVCMRYLVALIAVSRFEDAERICMKCISQIDDKALTLDVIHLKEIFYYLLAEIYYYTGKYHRIFQILPNINDPDFEKTFRRSVLAKMASGVLEFKNDDDQDKEVFVTQPLKHIEEKHGFEFFMDPSELLQIVKENFDKCKAYNHKFAYVRMFRCDNVGIFLKNHVVCNHIQVVSCLDSPDYILSMYPAPLPGDVESFDITNLFNDKQVEKAETQSEENKLSRVDKFRMRNMKKRN